MRLTKEDDGLGARPDGPGSREPSQSGAVSPLPGFDPSRVWGGLTPAMRRSLLEVPGGAWLTAAELKPATGMGLTLLCVKHRLLERRWTQWGGELGQKHGEGYEYSLTARGLAVVGYATTPRDSEGRRPRRRAPFTTARAEGIARKQSGSGDR